MLNRPSRPGSARSSGSSLFVLTLSGDRICAMTPLRQQRVPTVRAASLTSQPVTRSRVPVRPGTACCPPRRPGRRPRPGRPHAARPSGAVWLASATASCGAPLITGRFPALDHGGHGRAGGRQQNHSRRSRRPAPPGGSGVRVGRGYLYAARRGDEHLVDPRPDGVPDRQAAPLDAGCCPGPGPVDVRRSPGCGAPGAVPRGHPGPLRDRHDHHGQLPQAARVPGLRCAVSAQDRHVNLLLGVPAARPAPGADLQASTARAERNHPARVTKACTVSSRTALTSRCAGGC